MVLSYLKILLHIETTWIRRTTECCSKVWCRTLPKPLHRRWQVRGHKGWLRSHRRDHYISWNSYEGLLREEENAYQKLWSSSSNRVPKSSPIRALIAVPHDTIQRRTSIFLELHHLLPRWVPLGGLLDGGSNTWGGSPSSTYSWGRHRKTLPTG